MINSTEKDSRLDVVLLNRSYPPVNTVTGLSAHRLVKLLRLQSAKVAVVSIDCKSAGVVSHPETEGSAYLLTSFYSGKNNCLRLFSSVIEGVQLVLKARSLRPKIVVVMTDPPLLSFWASILLGNKVKWVLWSMDLYPEAFCASKLISAKNPLILLINNILKSNPPEFVIALGDKQLEHLNNEYERDFNSVILPCGVVPAEFIDEPCAMPGWYSENLIIFGYCGNLGRAHSVEFLLCFMAKLDPKSHKFIVSVYGEKSDSFLDVAKLNPAVTIVDNVEAKQLSYIDYHLASLLPQWTHICVPSKTVSAVSAGSNFVFFGSRESDNWSMLSDCGWLVETDSMEIDVNLFFSNLPSIDNVEMRNRSLSKSKELRKLEEVSMSRVLEFVKM